MEDGTVVLVGATTENPSFELNAALLSRAQVLRLQFVRRRTIWSSWRSAPRRRLGEKLPLDDDASAATLRRWPMATGGRCWGWSRRSSPRPSRARCSTRRRCCTVVQRRAPIYDKKQDGHYNLISALHKTVRGSDPDAALYYFARMLVAGEDPLFLARRLIRMASRGYRHGRSAGAAAGDRGARCLRDAGLARGRTGAGASSCVYLARRAQIERGLHRLQRRRWRWPSRPARRCRR